MRKIKIASWCLYDFASTVFMMNIVSVAFVQWIDQNFGSGDTYYGIISSLGYALSVLLLPIAGEICDRGHKLLPLAVLTILSIAGTYFIGYTMVLWLGAALFIVAYLTYQLALTYYNSLLDDITTPNLFGVVSGLGVAARYTGAIFGLLTINFFIHCSHQQYLPEIAKKLIVHPPQHTRLVELDNNYLKQLQSLRQDQQKLPENLRQAFVQKNLALSAQATLAKGANHWLLNDLHPKSREKIAYFLFEDQQRHTLVVAQETLYANAFVPTALLYLIFTLPLFVCITTKRKQRRQENQQGMLATLIHNFRVVAKSRNTLWLLAAILLGGTPVYAGVHFMSVFLKKIGGVPDALLLQFLIAATIFSIFGGVGFGFSLRPLGNKLAFTIVMSLWVAVLLIGTFVAGVTIMWVLGAVAGIGMGGYWALARILILDLAPEGREGEYLSLFGIVVVLCGIASTLLWPLGVWIATSLNLPFTPQRLSTLLLSFVGIAGILAYIPVKFPQIKEK